MAQVRRARRAVQWGKRVFLCRPAVGDEAEFCELRLSSASFLRKWEPSGDFSAEGQREILRRMVRANRSPRFEKLFACSCDDGRLLGYIGINEIVRGAAQSAFVGYWIGKAEAHQGYMTEALSLAARHAFGSLGLHRLEANIIPSNERSRRLASRVGFRKEGLARRYLKIAGRWQDHERWALLAEDFRVPAPRGG